MLTRASKANANTEYFEMSSRGDMEPPLELDTAPSSDERVYLSNHIHVDDHMAPVRNIENDNKLTQLENEQRMHDIMQNSKMMLKSCMTRRVKIIHSIQQTYY